MTIETRGLGESGRNYIREHLAGTNAFCKALLETFTIWPGEVFTLAPAGTAEDRLTQFQSGGLLPENLSMAGAIHFPGAGIMVPVVSLRKQQAKLLRDTLVAAAESICIVDDFNPSWHAGFADQEPAAFGCGEEAYHLLTDSHGDEDFEHALSLSETIWHGVAAVCRIAPKLDAARETSVSELGKCAESAMLITCTAYDGEGFVAWRRIAGEGC